MPLSWKPKCCLENIIHRRGLESQESGVWRISEFINPRNYTNKVNYISSAHIAKNEFFFRKRRGLENLGQGNDPRATELLKWWQNLTFLRIEKSYVILGLISTFPKKSWKWQIINNFPSLTLLYIVLSPSYCDCTDGTSLVKAQL